MENELSKVLEIYGRGGSIINAGHMHRNENDVLGITTAAIGLDELGIKCKAIAMDHVRYLELFHNKMLVEFSKRKIVVVNSFGFHRLKDYSGAKEIIRAIKEEREYVSNKPINSVETFRTVALEPFNFEKLAVKLPANIRSHDLYFNNTGAYAIAYAIYYGYEEIHLHGIDYGGAFEKRDNQRGCTEYWCGIAEGMGIKVLVNPASLLLDRLKKEALHGRKLYGYFTERELDLLQEYQRQLDGNIKVLQDLIPYNFDEEEIKACLEKHSQK